MRRIGLWLLMLLGMSACTGDVGMSLGGQSHGIREKGAVQTPAGASAYAILSPRGVLVPTEHWARPAWVMPAGRWGDWLLAAVPPTGAEELVADALEWQLFHVPGEPTGDAALAVLGDLAQGPVTHHCPLLSACSAGRLCPQRASQVRRAAASFSDEFAVVIGEDGAGLSSRACLTNVESSASPTLERASTPHQPRRPPELVIEISGRPVAFRASIMTPAESFSPHHLLYVSAHLLDDDEEFAAASFTVQNAELSKQVPLPDFSLQETQTVVARDGVAEVVMYGSQMHGASVLRNELSPSALPKNSGVSATMIRYAIDWMYYLHDLAINGRAAWLPDYLDPHQQYAVNLPVRVVVSPLVGITGEVFLRLFSPTGHWRSVQAMSLQERSDYNFYHEAAVLYLE